MANSRAIPNREVPDLSDKEAWADLKTWLRGRRVRRNAAGAEALTLWGWVKIAPGDRLLRLPGRQLYHFTRDRWEEAAPLEVEKSGGLSTPARLR